MTDTKTAAGAGRRGPRSPAAVKSPPSSALRSARPALADEVAGLPDFDEPFLQLADGEDWPEHFGAARLGIP